MSMATEGSKEELMKLCENDSIYLTEKKMSSWPITWDYIEINYDVIELGEWKFHYNQ